MELSQASIFGVTVTTASKEDILLYIHQFMHAPDGEADICTITTPNPEQVMYARKNTVFQKTVNASDIALPDGAGLRLAQRAIRERIAGSDFLEDLCRLSVTNKWPIGCIGGRDGVSQRALEVLQTLYPGLTGWASDGPEIPDEKDDVIGDVISVCERMKKEGTRILFIGFGAPKQELFMAALKKRLQKDMPHESVILMVVGGSFDMLAGKIKRAPKFVQNIGFEWLWRLIKEPWRWKRQLALLQFLWMVVTQKLVMPQKT